MLKYKEINAGFLLKYKDLRILLLQLPIVVCFISYFFFTVVLMIIFFGMFHIGNEIAFRR